MVVLMIVTFLQRNRVNPVNNYTNEMSDYLLLLIHTYFIPEH